MKNKCLIRLISTIIIVLFGSTITSYAEDEKVALLNRLQSRNIGTSSQAFHEICSLGLEMIPALVSNLNNTEIYSGECGRNFRSTWKTYSEEEITQLPYTPMEIREVSLYLIMVILTNDAGIRDDCRMEVEDGSRTKAMNMVFSELTELYKDSLSDKSISFDYPTIVEVLKKNKIEY